jgi:hypothetical protein
VCACTSLVAEATNHARITNAPVDPIDSSSRLSEIENVLLGLPPFYLLESTAKPEVECFGHLLYELSMGSMSMFDQRARGGLARFSALTLGVGTLSIVVCLSL